MELEDFTEPEVLTAAALVAVAASPAARRVVRRGAVYGMAGLMMAADVVRNVATGIADSARHLAASRPAHRATAAAD
jgi:hypothetical protein